VQIPFKAISTFHVTARLGSLTKAAAELGVTPSAVSQQIAFLESHLGTSLISKTGRGIRLTEAGERYHEKIADDLDRIADATKGMRGFKAAPILTIRAAPTFTVKWLAPRLPTFLDANPNIELLFDANAEPLDYARENVDLEIRHGEGRWSGLFVDSIAEESIRPVCAPSLARERSLRAEDLPRHRLLHSVRNLVSWSQWFQVAGVHEPPRWSRVMFHRSHMSIDAAATGVGIALESDLTTLGEREAGLLICPIRDPPLVMIRSLWIVCPYDHLRQAKVKTFIDWLTAAIASDVQRLRSLQGRTR
jgi:LysR family transcriptional regulator, glycine cleavage system transcriptional activator